MKRNLSFFTFFWFVIGLFRSVAWGSPLDLYGFGARARGMAGAATAVADDYSALYYNPAALSQRHDNIYQLGFITADPNARIELDPAPGISQSKRKALEALERRGENLRKVEGLEMGFVLSPHERFKAAIGVHVPQEQAVTLHPLDTHEPVFILHDHYADRSAAFLGASFTILPGLAIGLGSTVFVKVDGDLYIPLEAEQKKSDLSPSGVREDSQLTIDFPWTTQPFFGIFYQPTPRWRFGASYRSQFEWDVIVKAGADVLLNDYEIDLSSLSAASNGEAIKAVIQIDIPALGDTPLEIPVEIDGLEGSIVANAQASLSGALKMVDFWSPQQVSFGTAYNPTDQWTVSADATWYDWSEMDSPEMEILIDDVNINIQTLPASVRARIRNLTIPVLGTVGSVPPVTVAIPGLDASLKVPLKFKAAIRPPVHDVVHPRLGVEYHFLPWRSSYWTGPMELSVRGGYAYEPSPFDTDRGYVNVIDPDRHLFSTGAGAVFNDRFHLDSYLQYRYLSPVRFSKDYVDERMPFERVRAAGEIWATGIEAGVTW